MDTSQYLQIFIEESKENVQNLNKNLLKLEESPEEIQIVNEIFRVAHTLKGMSGTMGFIKMQRLTHHAENVLAEIRSNKLTINTHIIDVLFQCLDALEHYVEEISETSMEGEESYNDLIDRLEKIIEGKDVSENNTLPREVIQIKDTAQDLGKKVFHIEVSLLETCVLKAARAFLVFNELGKIGEIIYAVPSVQEIEDEEFNQSFQIMFITSESQKQVEKYILNVAEIQAVRFLEKVNEPQKSALSVEKILDKEKEEQQQQVKQKEQKKQPVSTKSVRVNIERLDTLMNLVSELIIVKTQLEGIHSQSKQSLNYTESIEYLERITTNLHDAVMKVRMVPVETVFNRFPRMIRDVSKKLGKEIELVMSGEETELDRIVIDEIGDPLIHLLRNAADHGLETTEERKSLGKRTKGTIKLRAYQDGNSVVIEVGDDGKGIDANKIKKKALEKGNIKKEVLDSMTEQEAIQLLFAPSFSTAEAVTDLSGRGVGLDVVKSKITALGGEVEIRTEVGKGSVFIIRLPLTLAIIQALLVGIGEEKYAIPLSNIQNIEEIEKEEIKLIQNQEVIMIREQIIPVIKLAEILECPVKEQHKMMVVIVKKGEKQLGLIVDNLIGQQEIVIKPLGKYLRQIDMIAGATILGNGEVALILDVNTLV